MHSKPRFLFALLFFLISSLSVSSQTRDVRAGRIFLDDGSSEGVLIVAPTPMPGGSSYTLTLPTTLPTSGFFLTGDASGTLTAAAPLTVLDTVAWLLTGNAATNPATMFLGTTDSTDFVLRTNNVEQLRVTARGDVGVGTIAPLSATLHVAATAPDTAIDDPLLGIPLTFGVRSELTSPSSTFSDAIYVASGDMMLIEGSNDLSAAGSFHGNVGLVLNANDGGAVSEVVGVFGLVMQVDPGASVADDFVGVHGEAQIHAGAANNAMGVYGDIRVGSATVPTAASIRTRFEIEGTGSVTDGYGLYLQNPSVNAGATLTNYDALYLADLDSGMTAIHYDGSGTNAPFILEGDGDVGIGTASPYQARLHVVKTFEDSVQNDPMFGIPLTMGVRTNVTSPSVADTGAIYVGSGTISSVTGTNDLSPAGQFVGAAAVIQNSNTGGTVNGMMGFIGQASQTDAGSISQFLSGVEGQLQIADGIVSGGQAVSGAVQVSGGAITTAASLSTRFDVAGSAAVTQGYGLNIAAPSVDVGATLTDYTGIEIADLPISGQNAIHYNGSATNAPFILEGDGDVGIGTITPGDARLRVERTFADTVLTDPFFSEPLAFGIRSNATNPSVALANAIYVGTGSLSFVQGADDMSAAGAFVGAAGLAVNTNTGGSLNTLVGLVGQALQDDPGAESDAALGVLGEIQQIDGTLTNAIGVMGSASLEGGTISDLIGLAASIDMTGTASVTRGVGVHVSDPNVGGGASLTDFTGIRIEGLTGGASNTAIRYDGPAPFVVEADGDVAIGVSGASARLDVENDDASVPALQVSNTNADGIGLEVTDGRIVLSYDGGAPATIPSDVAVFSINDGIGASAPTLALPATATNGQILYVYVFDPDGATVNGNVRASGDSLIYVFAGGAWRLFSVN